MTQETQTKGKRPSHKLYVVTGEGENAIWKAIGGAWPHLDGNGFSISVDALPINGRIVMRLAKTKADERQGELV